MKKTLLVVGALALAGLLGFYIYRSSRPVVEVVAAKRGTAVFAVYGTVKVDPTLTFNMRARSGGVLKYTDELAKATNLVGFTVKAGEYLGEIVNETLDRDFEKARAEWDAAQGRSKLGPPGLPTLKTQEALVKRMQKLLELTNVPPSEVEHAMNDLTSIQETVRQQTIEIDRSSTVAKQEYDKLKEAKERCRFVSPIDGLINAVSGVNGEFVNEGATPFTVVTITCYLEGQINEDDVGHVSPQMKAAVKLYAYPDRELSATVSQIIPTATNQRYTVNLNFEDAPANLMAGETGEMNIISGTRPNALLIPTRALSVDKVWIVKDGVASPRSVKVGFRNLEQAEILDGLQEGDKVVVADQDLLRTGMGVRAVTVH